MLPLLTTLDPAPTGFEWVQLTKRHLLSGAVGVLVLDLGELPAVLENYAQRMLGIVMTIGDAFQLEKQSALLWHVTLPVSWLEIAASLAQGWLSAITSADDANQNLHAMEFRVERLGRELTVTRRDYNELTERLQSQVRDLLLAKDELSTLNTHLEVRVNERTAQLARANESLSMVVDDLKRTQDDLIRTAELVGLGSLVAGIAHELNTPIGVALTVTTCLAAESRTLQTQYHDGALKRSSVEKFLQETEEMTTLLERNIVTAAGIVTRLKQLANDQAGEVRQRFRLDEVIADTLAIMDSQLKSLPYRIQLELANPIEMDSYPGAITQILTNLINNSIRHGFDGRSEGTITINAAVQDKDMVKLSFADDGCGISPDHLTRVFHPFFSTKFGQGGSGLGLYVAYNKAQKILGGRLVVSSELGHGSCFELSIPRIASHFAARIPAP